jgi:hypothetical protein
MTLLVRIPQSYFEERQYICRYILQTRLNVEIEFATAEDDGRTIITDADGRRITIPDGLFATSSGDWLTPACRPVVRKLALDFVSPAAAKEAINLVALYGEAQEGSPAAKRLSERQIELSFDPLGGAFFLLTGMEEILDSTRDEHGRFPASHSLLSRHGLELRPICDEYVAYLAACLEMLWPGICRPGASYSPAFSHDLDHPFLYHSKGPAGVAARLALRLVGDVVLRKSAGSLAETCSQFASYLWHGPEKDPYFSIDALMDSSEAAGLSSCFYIIADPQGPMDGIPYVDDPLFRRKLKEVAGRGHSVGLHASYSCYGNPERAKQEAATLRRLLEQLEISQERVGVRQHYLRWSGPEHWRFWDDAGIDYDATMGFSDRVGFRCGTTHSYPVFDLKSRKALRIEERPLAFMDVSRLPPSGREWKKQRAQTLEEVQQAADACRAYGGTFELLWHNTSLQSEFARIAYRDVRDLACA